MVGSAENSPNAEAIDHVTVDNTSTSSFSDLTTRSYEDNASRVNIGQFPTPPPMELGVNETEYEAGYDSDGQLGPFFDAVRGEEVDGYYEEPITNNNSSESTSDNTTDTSADTERNQEKFSKSDTELNNMRKKDLVDECKKLGIDHKGNKGLLVARLMKAREDDLSYLSAEEMNNPGREQLMNDGFAPSSKWMMIGEPEDKQMKTDELEVNSIKYRAPTTPREEFERTGDGGGGVKKFDFDLKIERSEFSKSAEIPKLDRLGRLLKNRMTGEPVYENKEIKKMVPNMQFFRKHGLSLESQPYDYFNAFLPFKKSRQQRQVDGPFTIGDWTRFTNLKAELSNAGKGGTIYTDFVPFTVEEMMKHIGVYFLHGISPSPQVEMKMMPQCDDPFNGNDLVFNSLGRNAQRRHKHFKCFFALQDPRIAVPSRKTHPNWKVEPFLKQALKVCKEAVVVGENCAIDEQTNGFQGKHEDKKRHDEKREGDGFQSDSLNVEGGYTWAFYFRNQPPPPKLIEEGLSPLHARTLALIAQLDGENHCVYMDNLYLSAKLCLHAWKKLKAKVHGVCRQGGRGIPEEIKQEAKTKQNEEYQARGTLKVAVCCGDEDMTDIICTSLYDVKPFYMMSTVCSTVQWTKKFVNVFCTTQRKIVSVPFYRLNLADEYNNKMGRVDVGDQLRNYYRFDHFMRKRKWWWSFWMWGMGMLLTNAYIIYKRFNELHSISPRFNHYDFVCNIAQAWLKPDIHFHRKPVKDNVTSVSSDTSVTEASSTMRSKRKLNVVIEEIIKRRKIGMTDQTIKSQFKLRLNQRYSHFPVPATSKTAPRCQLHSWATNSQMRKKAGVVLCEVCDVHLCLECFKDFHCIHDLMENKSRIANRCLAVYDVKPKKKTKRKSKK